ncbi:MAG: ABC transporter permease [Deltaproteobacteria bacterium]|nr:ABC transporter permease [Deltaproteobacteria bacterium]
MKAAMSTVKPKKSRKIRGNFTQLIWKRSHLVYPLSFLLGVILWELIAVQLPDVVFATPSKVFVHIVKATVSGVLPKAFFSSTQHMILGLLLSLTTAIPLGFLMGRSETAFQMFDPVVNAIFSIPSITFVPFLIIWFGLFFEARVALVFVMSFFDILVTVAAGARNIEPALINVGRSFGAKKWEMFFKVMVPASLPFLFTAVRIGTVRAINAMITAELFFATVNLGEYMEEASAMFDAAGVLAVVFLLAFFGLGAQEGIKRAEGKALPWHISE